MDKRDRAVLFRTRLQDGMQRLGLRQAELARATGLERSTLSQLMATDVPRLPSAHALGEIASALQVSSDWLLGLSNQRGAASEVLEQAVQMTDAARHPVDEQVLSWSAEAAGSKVRHVPAGVPDLFKIEPVLTFEFADAVRRTPEQAITDTQAQMALLRQPGTDLEIALPAQTIELFAGGHGQWRGLSSAVRRKQLAHMAAELAALYPTARLYAFDQNKRFSVPFSVYGQQRVAIYIGQRYLAFAATRYVQLMARHFDDLVRAASVNAHEASAWVEEMARKVR